MPPGNGVFKLSPLFQTCIPTLSGQNLRRCKMHSFEKLIDAYVKKLISVKAARLAKCSNDPAVSPEDMEQELYLELLKQSDKYNPDRASFHTFAKHVICAHMETIIRKSHASKRGRNIEKISIHEQESGEDFKDCMTLIEKIDAQDAIHLMGGNSLSEIDRIERIKEIRSLLKTLPKELRKACDLIMQEKSISETAEIMEVSRPSFYYQKILPLRKIFTEEFSINFISL